MQSDIATSDSETDACIDLSIVANHALKGQKHMRMPLRPARHLYVQLIQKYNSMLEIKPEVLKAEWVGVLHLRVIR